MFPSHEFRQRRGENCPEVKDFISIVETGDHNPLSSGQKRNLNDDLALLTVAYTIIMHKSRTHSNP